MKTIEERIITKKNDIIEKFIKPNLDCYLDYMLALKRATSLKEIQITSEIFLERMEEHKVKITRTTRKSKNVL